MFKFGLFSSSALPNFHLWTLGDDKPCRNPHAFCHLLFTCAPLVTSAPQLSVRPSSGAAAAFCFVSKLTPNQPCKFPKLTTRRSLLLLPVLPNLPPSLLVLPHSVLASREAYAVGQGAGQRLLQSKITAQSARQQMRQLN